MFRLTLACLFMLSGFPSVAKEGDAPAIRALYRSEWQPAGGAGAAPASVLEWRFERHADSVEIADVASRGAERWRRDEGGRVWYSRVFHADRKIVEYRPADLALGGIADAWAGIQSVIDLQLLAQLPRSAGTAPVLGHATVNYRGMHDGVDIQIGWLDELNIPATFTADGSQGRLNLRLLEVQVVPPESGGQLPAEEQLEDYETLEFSDLGDRAGDPFVEKLLHADPAWLARKH